MTTRTKLTRKAVDDVLGGEAAWADADSTMGRPLVYFGWSLTSLASCPKCNHDKAYFHQLQIRSADEPMTTCKFYVYSSHLLIYSCSLPVGSSVSCTARAKYEQMLFLRSSLA